MVKRESPKVPGLVDIKAASPLGFVIFHGGCTGVRGRYGVSDAQAGPPLLSCGQTNFQAWFEVFTFITDLIQVN